MKITCFVGLFMFFPMPIMAQKVVEKIVDATSIETLQIAGDGMYTIHVQTVETNEIKIVATIDGEIFKDIILLTNQQEKSFRIAMETSPFYVPLDDKLAAHKVLSFSIELCVPEKLNVAIASTTAHVYLSGAYNTIEVELQQGRCQLDMFEGSGTIQTIVGDVYGSVTKKVQFATNQNHKPLIQNDLKTLWVTSKDGDILLSQTK
jgi:hypothetical protein